MKLKLGQTDYQCFTFQVMLSKALGIGVHG
jgi:hypothetical protein